MPAKDLNSVLATDAGPQKSAEWQARVDLAAAHRLAVMHDMSEGIFNHLTMVVPGKSDRFLLIPFGMHWSEATASSFLEVSYEGKILSGEGDIERSSVCIHAPIHRLNPKAAVIFHTHMPYASALTRLQDQRLLPIGQTEVCMMNKIAYDDRYPGFVHEPEEGERLAKLLRDKSILFMANHGVLVTGETVGEAYDRLYYLERACQVQVYAMWTQRELHMIDPAVVKLTNSQQSDSYLMNNPKPARKSCELHFDALKRVLERKEGADYRS
ncbi:ribulose-5-phosphate 4-epimerase/fuculose-1-phosphate aldolase [Bradyrhizobium sp. USDA 4524]|uniref:class II aldolase/adducin family protein n=1 Tax=unclassified Bradyrhizobium TaxID=2631580 RepID=UPI00209C869E|nr:MULTISPECIES: class II aldolase/adducin family protein [unclassified Bradyrhizobium]MCP1838545.1 ribulose-5-phosphate 4-epimerase/fuculose-1-phosphate aldolase [Bradyrhizobium sp. USDA 4538]MCP1899110.1 ribulose-5-phosphate 4-epimerase/fuculose-1-phosphate aldolase [Bradyrhizobium sp. USDA 4537]MCP1986777.1 ribulose-5-phosphate 4-epimerase/fuculose-1-phosphate aldolase [Bradyrhizobium sp. USDA 4539]